MGAPKSGAAEKSAAPVEPVVEEQAKVEPVVEEPPAAEAAPADGVIPPDDAPEGATPGEDVGAIDADTGFADSAEGDVTVIVAIAIGGTRDGEPWPAVGEAITLPADEAADYLRFGYVREVEPTE